MTWIKTIPLSEANENLLQALEWQRSHYPKEYATPVFGTDDGVAGIVGSHSLIPDALYHAFSTFGVLMSPELPLARRQHEMIATRTLRSASTCSRHSAYFFWLALATPHGLRRGCAYRPRSWRGSRYDTVSPDTLFWRAGCPYSLRLHLDLLCHSGGYWAGNLGTYI